MPIETSMYNQNLAPDIGGALQQGMSIKNLMRQRELQEIGLADEKAVREAFKQAATVGPDGSVSLDRPKLMSNLYGSSPMKAMEWGQKFEEQDAQKRIKDLEMHRQRMDTAGRLFGGVSDQASYDLARPQAIKHGMFDQNELPAQYDPNLVKNIQMRTLSYKEQLDHQFKQQEMDIKRREVGAKEREAGGGPGGAPGKMTEAQSKALGFGRRAMLADQMIDRVLADPKSDVSSLRTQFKSGLPKWLGGVKDQREQDVMTAKLSFIASVLRKESGAAVTKEEFEQYGGIYFPGPGDSPETIADKSTMRKNFVDTEKMTAGHAWRDPIPLSKRQDVPSPQAPKQGQTKVWEGITYKLVGNEWKPQ